MKKILTTSILALLPLTACTAGSGTGDGSGSNGNGSGNGSGSNGDGGIGDGLDDGGIDGGGLDGGGSSGSPSEQPMTCADAAASKSYVGCDFWPTITSNPVAAEFEFAVVMANGTGETASVTITGPHGFSHEDSIPAGELKTIKLPWVPELKGPEFTLDRTTGARHNQTSLSMEGGAYHVQTTVPVSAWQFNPLNFRKDLADCGRLAQYATTECRAASNDATLLLPSTAMTGNYRVATYAPAHGSADWGSTPGGFAVTATKDGTTLTVQLPPDCEAKDGCLMSGGVIANVGTPPAQIGGYKGDILSYEMNAGDVIQFLGAYAQWEQERHADLSGSLINATQPVQVIGYTPITFVPDDVSNPDHIEEIVLPAEVIGTEYIVAPPSAHSESAPNVVGHIVRLYGNVDGTVLEYPEGKPAGAPDVINAGEVVQIPPWSMANTGVACIGNPGQCMVSEPFIVKGNQPFAVNSFHVAGKLQAPTWPEEYAQPGDPAVSMMVTPEQFRQDYTFLAPADFMSNWADITVPVGADVVLDGVPVAEAPTPIGASSWGILRVKLDSATGGIHTLSTSHDAGLGLQVSGFGNATSYYYPGGLNLKLISEPPVIIVK